MINASWAKAVVAVGGLALSLTTGVAVASAQPDLSPLVNTSCTYQQAVAALKAEAPAAAQEFNQSIMAQTWLSSFLAAPPAKRQSMAQSLQSMSSLQQYLGVMNQVAASCNGY